MSAVNSGGRSAGWAAGPQPLRLTAGGLHWAWRHWGAPPGQAPAWLLLHGTGASGHSFEALAPLLWRAAAGQLTLWAPDLPGHGASAPMPPTPTPTGLNASLKVGLNAGSAAGFSSTRGDGLARMASALAEALLQLRLQPEAVLGHSAGAALMLQLALQGQLPAARLLALNAALQPFHGLAGWLMPRAAQWLAASPWAWRLTAQRARSSASVRRLIATTGSRLDDAGVAAYAALMADPRHVAGALAMMADWPLDRLQQDLDRFDRPLDWLVAQNDSTVPPAQAQLLARRWPFVHLHPMPGLGHLAHEEAPQSVAAHLTRLARLDLPANSPG